MYSGSGTSLCDAEEDEWCRLYSRRVEGGSKVWLAQQLQSELQSLQAESSKVQEQSQGQDQNGFAGSSPGMTALLQLRRQISAYQVTALAQND